MVTNMMTMTGEVYQRFSGSMIALISSLRSMNRWSLLRWIIEVQSIDGVCLNATDHNDDDNNDDDDE